MREVIDELDASLNDTLAFEFIAESHAASAEAAKKTAAFAAAQAAAQTTVDSPRVWSNSPTSIQSPLRIEVLPTHREPPPPSSDETVKLSRAEIDAALASARMRLRYPSTRERQLHPPIPRAPRHAAHHGLRPPTPPVSRHDLTPPPSSTRCGRRPAPKQCLAPSRCLAPSPNSAPPKLRRALTHHPCLLRRANRPSTRASCAPNPTRVRPHRASPPALGLLPLALDAARPPSRSRSSMHCVHRRGLSPR